MLNELVALHHSLVSRGIATGEQHPWIQPYKKGEAVVTELNEAGQIERVSAFSAEEVANLRNIVPDNQKSFPGFNLKCPVLKVTDTSLWNQPAALWEIARATTPGSPLVSTGTELNPLRRFLRSFPLEIAACLQADDPKLQSTQVLLDRLKHAELDPASFLYSFCLQVVSSATEGRLSREFALAILFGKPSRKKRMLEEWRASLILDVSDIDRFPYRVADPAVPQSWSYSLFAWEGASANDGFICGLTGKVDSPIPGKMPNCTLPIIGKTYLFSMNRDVPCQTRYRRIASKAFAAGKRSVQAAYDALRFITDKYRQDRTWGGIPSGTRKNADLLIAYLENEPESESSVVRLFADMPGDPLQQQAIYEERTAPIYEALKLQDKPGVDSAVKVFVLSRIDTGRAQVLFSKRYPIDAILNGRDHWLRGAANVPEIRIPFLQGKGKPLKWQIGYKPSPSEVAISFKRQWIRDGTDSSTVPGVDMARVYSLLLEPEARQQAEWLMSRYLRLTAPLFIGASRFLSTLSLSKPASLSDDARKEVLIAVAVFGILLLSQGRTKEIYMNSREYLLGQFLQMADLLHKLYCVRQRKGSIPPQLIGNAAISMALNSPRRAFQVLGERMPVYLAWADCYDGDDVSLVRWCRNELGRLSSKLKDEALDVPISDNGKAELLLGYLARSTKENRQENAAS